MIIELKNPSLADDLSSFLDRCPCIVRRVGATGLVVTSQASPGEPDVRCWRCGDELDSSLSRLGSLFCLDCRAGVNRDVDGDARRELSRIAAHRELSETQIRAFVRVWQALHPESEGNLRLVA